MNIKTFNADLNKFAKATNLEIEEVVRKVAFDVYTGVVQKTPVDTGRAKSNWNIGKGSIDYSIRLKDFSFRAMPINKGAGKNVIYITNSLPYINRLENGWSKQAPKGMVTLTMNDIQRTIRNVIRQ